MMLMEFVKTSVETYEKIKKQVYVIGQDVDILALLTALTPDYIDILMLKEGKVEEFKHGASTKFVTKMQRATEYDLTIKYKTGRKPKDADKLSRNRMEEETETSEWKRD
ncbi:hypothetical protein AVEN_106834-1 [Araneus ventricosus]|uniref:Uncharacterized protein n=1 Tax=Araneus ventricosus TaxID=182803 RepID=A0A4Y2PZP2_ARAVE|nr:hypothetical protein AVEN_106834-1 [Araneus ventricosus]